MLGKTIFKAAPGAAMASAWIKPGTNGLTGIFGVFADEKSSTLWACSGNPPGPPTRARRRPLRRCTLST